MRLVKNAYELGLRTTEHLLSKVRLNSETLIQEIVSNVREKHPELQAKYDVENAVRRFLFWLVETLCFSTIKNISRSVGHRDLAETYEEISTGQESNAYKLIRVSIELDTHGVKETALKITLCCSRIIYFASAFFNSFTVITLIYSLSKTR